jgi:hypothetical protein
MNKTKSKNSDKRRQRKSKAGPARLPSQTSVTDIVKRFAVCGRCSFFVAGYKLLVGEEVWETAVSQTDGRWLRLTWNANVRQLISRSFGSRLDIGCYYYEGCCPECRRLFQYRAADGKELEQPLLQIEL